MRLQEIEHTSVYRAPDGEISALLGIAGGTPRGEPYLGVRALMLAMLEEAIRAYLGNEPRGVVDAAQWIGSRARWVFAFSTVCETLGLEPTAARSALRRMRTRDAAGGPIAIARSRPNARQANLRVVTPRRRRRPTAGAACAAEQPTLIPPADR